MWKKGAIASVRASAPRLSQRHDMAVTTARFSAVIIAPLARPVVPDV